MMSNKQRVHWSLVLGLTLGAFVVTTMAEAPEAEAQRRVTTKKRKRYGVSSKKPVVGLRGGLVLSGSGQLSSEANGTTTEFDYTDNSGFAVNAFGLFPIGNYMRVGASAWYYPSVSFDATNANNDDPSTATAFDLNAMFEYSRPIQTQIRAYGYGEAGYSSMTPEEGAAEGTDPETFSGFNLALGIGAAYGISDGLEVRGELRYQPIYSLAATSQTANTDVTSTFSGQRILLCAGVGFGL
jgi:hypothetical protein